MDSNHRFGKNAVTVNKQGEGILTEVHVQYKCGCEYNAGCFDMGEGFDHFCEDHADRDHEFEVMLADVAHLRNGEATNRIWKERIAFYNQIKGL